MGDINWKDRCWVTTIYLVRENKEVLLTWNKNINTWIPVGGHIDPGETPEEAIKREVEEETGFEFDFIHQPITESKGLVRVLKPNRIQIERVPHHNLHMNIVFYGKCKSYNDKSETDEKEKLKWFSQSDLDEIKDKMLENVYLNASEAISLIN